MGIVSSPRPGLVPVDSHLVTLALPNVSPVFVFPLIRVPRIGCIVVYLYMDRNKLVRIMYIMLNDETTKITSIRHFRILDGV